MIEYLKGEVTELNPATAILECNGVGYDVNISLNTYSVLSAGTPFKLYIYEAIREDAHILYGFADRHERELFLLLVSVPGVGPNTARMILSSLSSRELEQVILTENVGFLKGVKGIGVKTAQRIIVDLRDKIKPAGVTLDISTPLNPTVQEEALAALQMLGFARPASQKVVQNLLKESPAMTVEEVIKAALKML